MCVLGVHGEVFVVWIKVLLQGLVLGRIEAEGLECANCMVLIRRRQESSCYLVYTSWVPCISACFWFPD